MMAKQTGRDTKDRLVVVRRVTATEAAAEQILQLFNDNSYTEGDLLPSEQQLMAQLGVGRSTVREALQRLAVLGLVDGQPGRGWVVKSPRASELGSQTLSTILRQESADELFELRVILDTEIAALAAVRATAEDLKKIESALRRTLLALENGEETLEYSLAFHEALAAAAHNQALSKVYKSIARLMREVSGVPHMSTADAKQLRLEEHQAILDALLAHDPEAARQAMRRHIGAAHEWVTKSLISDSPSDNTN